MECLDPLERSSIAFVYFHPSTSTTISKFLNFRYSFQVGILNTGYVTSDFYITVTDCSEGVDDPEEKHRSIDPQTTEKMEFTLHQREQEDQTNTCIVTLYDSKRLKIDQRNVSFAQILIVTEILVFGQRNRSRTTANF